MKPIHSELRERAFFRKLGNDLLRRFFERHGVLGEIEWDGRGEADVKDVHEAYTELPSATRNRLADDLEYINDLASQRGMPCLVDAAYRWNVDCKDMTAHDLAMLLFLDHKDAFDTAHSWWTLNHFQGYTDFRGREAMRLSDPERGKPELEVAFSEFLSSPAKAVEVQVDVYKDSNKLAYVVTHEDYVQPVERFKGHELVVIKYRPVFYATMVYYPNLGKLKVKASKGEMVEFIRDSFAEHILRRNDFFRHAEVNLIYDFERFKRPWRFEPDPADDIEWVRIVGLRFKPDPGGKDTVEVKSYTNLPERLRSMNVELQNVEVDQVSMCFKFPGKGRKGMRSVNLRKPNGNNLGDSKNDQMIERYLVEWEIANM